MKTTLTSERRKRGWTQQELASKLGVTQAYLCLLERGRRQLPGKLATQLVRAFRFSPQLLPLPEPTSFKPGTDFTNAQFAAQLAAFGYEPLAYLEDSFAHSPNPLEVLCRALAQEQVEARLVESLPWLAWRFAASDAVWLGMVAKLNNLQNRLGFVVDLALGARQVGVSAKGLTELRAELERSRLAKMDTLCDVGMTDTMKTWLRQNASPAARKWNLLSDWRSGDVQCI